MMSARVF